MKKFKAFVAAHKFISVVAGLIIVGGAYYGYKDAHPVVTVTKYVIQQAAQGTVISSVTGSGQVQAATEIDVKPQVSETVDKIYVQVGQHVSANQLLMQLDTTNEQKALTQAQLSLQSSQLSLAKLQEAPATTTLLQDQNAVTQDEQNITDASTTIAKDYQNGFNALSSAFVDFQTVMSGMQEFVLGYDVSRNEANPDAYVDLMSNGLQPEVQSYADQATAAYHEAVTAYQQNLLDFRNASANSSTSTLQSLFSETYTTAQTIDTSVKDAKAMMNFVVNSYPSTELGVTPLPSVTNTFQTDLGNYTNTMDSDVAAIFSAQNTLSSDQTSLANDSSSLVEAQQNLATLQAGADPLDIQSQNLSIEQSQLSLQTAEQNLADDSIRAPIAGVVSAIPSVAGETVASPAASIVSDGEVAQVTLNEVDAAKVALNDQATLTFDAINGLSLAGKVIEIDPVGTVSQGVVNYNVQISFSQPADTSSTDMVKPGMSVTADIVTQADQNVIALPNSAVETSASGGSYVLEPASAVSSSTLAASANGGVTLDQAPVEVPVTLGISNDTMTEITSGVNVGDQVITQTMTSTGSAGATASAASGASGLRLLGGGAGAGGGATFGGGAGGGTRTFTGGAGGGVRGG